MATVQQKVDQAIDEDIILQGAIARNVVNRRAVARWLERYRDIDAGIDAIYAAVEGYKPSVDGWEARGAWRALKGKAPQRLKPVTILILDRGPESFLELASFFDPDVFEYQESYRIIPSHAAIMLVVDEAYTDDVIDILGPHVTKVDSDYVQTSIQPRHGSDQDEDLDGWRLASIVMALASAGVDVRHAVSAHSEHFVVFPEDQEGVACRVFEELLINPVDERIEDE